jgi:LuxR family maltose regulon positive regulatory protein
MPLVERRRLVAALRRCPSPLIVMAAPAGAGKTTALTQWASMEPRPVAWLHLDRFDNDLAVFILYLAAALDGLTGPDLEKPSAKEPTAPPRRESALPAIVARVEAAGPFLLVLDDAHVLENPRCWEIVQAVVDELPAGAQLAIGTRESPPLPLGRLRASAAVAEFDMADLRLSHDEADELLANLGLEVDHATCTTLLELIEGWATGFTLTALACRGRPVAEWLPQVRGDQRMIAEYLTGEILDDQPEEVRIFLLQVSILDQLYPEVCRAITGRTDAAEMLERIARANLFLTRVDESRRHYRFHHLFAEYLQAELGRAAPSLGEGAHRRAAVWNRESGEIGRSIHHSLAAGDVDVAADLLSATWVRFMSRGRFDTAAGLLSTFGEDQIAEHAALAIAAGWLALTGPTSQADPERLRTACTVVVDGPSADGAASLRSSQLILRALAAPDGVHRMYADAEAAMHLERGSSNGWRANAALGLGIACWFTGDARHAITLLSQSVHDGEGSNLPAVMTARTLLALVAHERGDLERAADHADTALSIAADMDPESGSSLTLVHAAVALTARGGQDPDAAAALARAGELWQHTVHLPWVRILAALVIAEAHVERGDIPVARRWIDAARRSLDTYADAGSLSSRAHRIESLLLDESIESITPAERRVLCLLPTHLSTQAIADHLFVSRNTVKTEMTSIYRKLGSAGRAEAVDKALALGLLEPPPDPSAVNSGSAD